MEIDEIIKETNERFERSRSNCLDDAMDIYKDVNHGELLVSTGAFILLVNFLIGKNELEHTFYLKLGAILLASMIIIKSLMLRRSADRREREILFLEKRNKQDNELFFLYKKKEDGDSLTEEENEKALKYEEKVKNFYKDFDKFRQNRFGRFLNDLEAILYIAGIITVLLFFLVNI